MLVCRECRTPIGIFDNHYMHQSTSDEWNCNFKKNILFANEVTDPSWLSALWYSACCGAAVHKGECTACIKRAMEIAYCPICATEMAYVSKPSHLYCPSCKLTGTEVSYDLEGSPFLAQELDAGL
jgi:hypothetical protein